EIHMTVWLVVGPVLRELQKVARPQDLVIEFPCLDPPRSDFLAMLKLREQEGREHVRWKEARADVTPGIFVNAPFNEGFPVGALLADDFGPRDQLRPVDEQC